jgi:hypothetical protein
VHQSVVGIREWGLRVVVLVVVDQKVEVEDRLLVRGTGRYRVIG